jgi:hypothetical protein
MRTAECELLFAAPLAAITGPQCLGMVVAAGRATGCKFLTALLATATGSGTGTVVVGWAARALLCSTAAAARTASQRHWAGPGHDGIRNRAAVRSPKCELYFPAPLATANGPSRPRWWRPTGGVLAGLKDAAQRRSV